MKIALIGPGIMPIPPTTWGAVEILIWDLAEAVRALGHEVTIFNSENLYEVAQQVNEGGFDFVHLQYDNHAGFLSKNINQPFCVTSHYGWILQKNVWDGGYHQIFKDMADCKGIIALSPEIEAFYRDNYDNEFITHLRNGTTIEKFRFNPNGNGRILYLGKVEPRKRQSWIAKNCPGLPIDFVGPVVDNTFQPQGYQRYLGSWTKEQVYNNLTDYSVLLLISGGEAAPLVVPEALAAGVSVVVNKESSANLPISDTYNGYGILSDDNPETLLRELNFALTFNPKVRSNIRAWAKAHFDWSVIAQDYIRIITNFIEHNRYHSKENGIANLT